MKKLIALWAIMVLFIASCDSSLLNPGDRQQAPLASSGIAENNPLAKADSGEMLYQQTQLFGIIGYGDVYPTHPGLSSVTNKPLPRITTIGSLVGVYANIKNNEGLEAVASSTNSFVYPPSDPHFDEVNLYYHIDRFRHEFIHELENRKGVNLYFTQITAHAHANHQALGDKGAWFDTSNDELYFGDASSSSTIKDLAKEDKTIYHEYVHAVIHNIISEITSEYDDEEAAISEGVPDYFAGSFTGRSVIGDYVFSDPNAPDEIRYMTNPDIGSYSEYQDIRDNIPPIGKVNSHKGGEFFSSILWDLRNSGPIDPFDVDFLVYDALYRIDIDPTFMEFRDAMMDADSTEFGGQYDDLIQNAFAAKGIGSPAPPDPSLEVTISGSYGLDSDQLGAWWAHVSNTEGPVTYEWYRQPVSICSTCWFLTSDTDDHYSTAFHNSAPHDQYARVKVVVNSMGERAFAIKEVYIEGCDDVPPTLPSMHSDFVTVNIIAPSPCPPPPPDPLP